MNLQIKKTMENLEKNNMKPFYCEDTDEALQLIEALIKKGETISNGGSETLFETGIISLLRSGKYNYLDRTKAETPEERKKLMRDSFFVDTYFTSANAVTESGELYNVDGNSNRVAAIAFGPEQVIVVVGVNKLVKDIDEAILRVKTTAAPKNTVRLNIPTYCGKTGKCVSVDEGASGNICAGCNSDGRICCSYLISAHQRVKDRIKVIIINQPLGY